MPLLARMLASPLSVDIRRGAVENLSSLLHERYISTTGHVLVAVGASQGEEIWRLIEPSLPEATVFTVNDASLASAGELQAALGERGYDAVVGIGGGRTLDVAKYAATRAALPMVAVATNLAHDGLCSPVASLEHAHEPQPGLRVAPASNRGPPHMGAPGCLCSARARDFLAANAPTGENTSSAPAAP